jgi:hypothetical protein
VEPLYPCRMRHCARLNRAMDLFNEAFSNVLQ